MVNDTVPRYLSHRSPATVAVDLTGRYVDAVRALVADAGTVTLGPVSRVTVDVSTNGATVGATVDHRYLPAWAALLDQADANAHQYPGSDSASVHVRGITRDGVLLELTAHANGPDLVRRLVGAPDAAHLLAVLADAAAEDTQP